VRFTPSISDILESNLSGGRHASISSSGEAQILDFNTARRQRYCGGLNGQVESQDMFGRSFIRSPGHRISSRLRLSRYKRSAGRITWPGAG
jgi:hypothetical protein